MIGRGACIFGLGLVAAVSTTLAGAAPSAFQLVFEGAHAPSTFPSLSGLQHEGPFTASPPFCASGHAVDIQQIASTDTAVRRFTCKDGSGDMTAQIENFPAEHAVGSTQRWTIVGGTGRYATLRGQGTWTTVSITGDLNQPATVGFITNWQGVVDFDDAAPSASISRASAKKLRRPAGVYVVAVAFSTRDGDGNAVTYRLRVRDPGVNFASLAGRSGQTQSGSAFSLRVRPTKRARNLLIELAVSDPVGNERSITRSVRLRR
jgi:hypothetical protein